MKVVVWVTYAAVFVLLGLTLACIVYGTLYGDGGGGSDVFLFGR